MTYPPQPPPGQPQWQQPYQQYPPVSGPPVSGGGYPTSPYPMPYSPPPQVVVIQPVTAPSSGMAVASMVLAILGLVTSCCSFGLFSVLAVILGHAAMAETKTGAKSGRGLAQAGLVMGYVVVIPAILFSAWIVFLGGLGAIQDVNNTPLPTPS